MGLDAAEFVLEIEEEFGISIADDEGAYFRTLGMVHDYLASAKQLLSHLRHCAVIPFWKQLVINDF